MPKLFKVEEFANRFKNLIKENIFNEVSFLTSNQLRAVIMLRVFNKGILTSGKKSGKYLSASYRKKRDIAGKLNNFKNFMFTETTKNSFKLLKNKQKNVDVGFDNKFGAERAYYQSEQMKKINQENSNENVIFSASSNEIKEATNKAVKKITKDVFDLINKQFR